VAEMMRLKVLSMQRYAAKMHSIDKTGGAGALQCRFMRPAASRRIYGSAIVFSLIASPAYDPWRLWQHRA
jgi:hypothetical protein